MIDESIPAQSGSTALAHTASSQAPLAHPRATTSEKDTRYVAAISLAAVLGSMLLGVNGAQ